MLRPHASWLLTGDSPEHSAAKLGVFVNHAVTMMHAALASVAVVHMICCADGKGCYFLAFVQLFEKYGTLIERYTALIEKVSALIGLTMLNAEPLSGRLYGMSWL